MKHIAIVLVSSLLIIGNFDGANGASSGYRTLFEYPEDAIGVNDLEGQEDAPIPVVQNSRGVISQLHSTDQLDKLRKNIPGEPDVDYPIFRTPPVTDFSCHGRASGYYADVQARCQVFRVCTNTDLSGEGFAFLCPNGSLFNQEVFVCDWYQHVDCNASENHYGKNVELKMKINSMSEVIAVVTEMVNFPLKTDQTRPPVLPAFSKASTTMAQNPITTLSTTSFVTQSTQRPNFSSHFTPSSSVTTRTTVTVKPLTTQAVTSQTVTTQAVTTEGVTIEGAITQGVTTQGVTVQAVTPSLITPQELRFGNHVITQEGDFELNSKTHYDNTKTTQQNTFSTSPIFISSLGELSTDAGNKFDINKSKIIKPEENSEIRMIPLTKEQQLKQSLSQSFKSRANTISPSEQNLANGLQQVLKQNPDYKVQVLSGENDLVQFIEEILQRNPDLTADKLNAILTAESDAILQILKDAVEKNQSGIKTSENEILVKIQNILNRHKNSGNVMPVFSGETDVLNTLQRILQQSQFPVFSGEADLVSFIEQLLQQYPEFTRQQLNAIISGETDSILEFLKKKKQQHNGQAIESGEAILLQAIEIILQKYRSQYASQIQPQITQQAVQSGESDLLLNILREIEQKSQIPIFSGQADLVSFIEQILRKNLDFTREELAAIFSKESDLILSILNQKKQQNNEQLIENGEAVLLEAIQIVLQKHLSKNASSSSQFSTLVPVQSGKSDLLDILREIQQQSKIPIFSGEADLVSFIEEILQKNPDFTRDQLNVIISGEANSILSILNQKKQQNNGQFIKSGKPILIDAIQNILQKYRIENATSSVFAQPVTQNNFQSLQTRTVNFGNNNEFQQFVPVQSGELNLLDALKQIEQQSQIPIFSGEADIVSFIELVLQQNPEFTREQLGSFISGEAESILSILNQKKQQNDGQFIQSGEAILLDAIQTILQRYRYKNTVKNTQFQQSVPVQSSEGDLLDVFRQIQQESQMPIFSGEADLVSFIELVLQQNPAFTREQLGSIISGEADSILSILNQRKQQNNGQFIQSGEAILLDAIQTILQKYRNKNTVKSTQFQQAVPVQSGEDDLLDALRQIEQQSQIPIFSGEADLVSFIELVLQQNPAFTREQLGSIISGEADSILSILNQRKQQNNGQFIQNGEAILLDAIRTVLQNHRNNSNQETSQIRKANDNNVNAIKSISINASNEQGREISPVQTGALLQEKQISTISQQSFIPTNPVESGQSDALQETLEQILLRIPNQKKPIFSGNANLSEFVQRLKEQNLDFSVEQLNAINGGEASSILRILNDNIEKNKTITSADLLQSIEQVIQKYRLNQHLLPPLREPVFAGENNLLETIQRIQQKSESPIHFNQSDLLQFVRRIEQQNPNLTPIRLNNIIEGGVDSILDILTNNREKENYNGFDIIESGEEDLLVAIQYYVETYAKPDGTLVVPPPTLVHPSLLSIPSSPLPLPLPPSSPSLFTSAAPKPQIQQKLQSGENDLLQAIQRIEQQSQILIFSGEADLVSFIEQIVQQNPDFTKEQLGAIISSEVDSIVQILNGKARYTPSSSIGTVGISFGEADLLNAIFQVLKKHRRNYQSTSYPLDSSTLRYTQGTTKSLVNHQVPQEVNAAGKVSEHSIHEFSSGQSQEFYQNSNENQANVGVEGKAIYSFQQNKQSAFSNNNSQITQSQVTQNVYRGQDNIYTQTAISHQTRSQSTSLNSQKIHYKITHSVPYQEPAAQQLTQSVGSSTLSPNTYIPPHTSRPSIATTPASKQVFTYPAVSISQDEVRNLTHAYRNTDKRQPTPLANYHSSKELHASYTHDKRNTDIWKDRQSTDLFLKGLHLSFFENNDLNQPVYQLQDQTKHSIRTRKSTMNYYGNISNKRNNKLADANNKTNEKNNDTVLKTHFNVDTSVNDTFKDIKSIRSTLTSDKAVGKSRDIIMQLPQKYNKTEPFLIQETEERSQSARVNLAKDSVKYQLINRQNEAAQKGQQQQQEQQQQQQEYVFTEIENRPLVNYDIPHPPLQTEYPKSIQNNVESRVVNRPKLRKYISPPIPMSLPSIVHQSSNTVATMQNIPANFASSLNSATASISTASAQHYSSSLPVITSTYSNHESGSTREKVVVKVVKAPGWYLNDANERSSYYNAVAHGLLNDNGLVYVNDVQKETAPQNVPINYTPFQLPIYSKLTQSSGSIQSPSTSFTSKTINPPLLRQSQQSAFNPTGYSIQSYNGINYWPPCFAAATAEYSQQSNVQVSHSQPPTQSRQLFTTFLK